MLLKHDETALDPRVKRTRRLLKEAFEALMAERKFQDIKVHDIAERAEVNRATFYAHFPDKYALLNYSVREAVSDLLRQRLSDPDRLTLDNLRLLIVTVSSFISQFHVHCRLALSGGSNVYILIAVQDLLGELLLYWFRSVPVDREAPAISPEQVATMMSWAIFGSALQRAQAERKLSHEQLADQTLTFFAPTLSVYLAAAAL